MPATKTTTPSSSAIMARYMDGLSVSEIGREMCLRASSVRAVIRESVDPVFCPSLKLSDNRRVSLQEQEGIARRYLEGVSCQALINEYGCSRHTLLRMLRQRGVSPHPHRYVTSVANRKASLKSVHVPGALYRETRKGAKMRSLPFEVSRQQLDELWVKQGGLCYYTGIPMNGLQQCLSEKELMFSPLSVSVDRRDSSKGYLLANTVLCCVFVNYLKSDWPESEAIQFIAAVRDASASVPALSEGPHISSRVLSQARRGASGRSRPIAFDISLEQLEAQFVHQRGLCFYTGVPLLTSPKRLVLDGLRGSPYLLSVDRRDSSRDYVKDNIALCCSAINLSKNRWSEASFRLAIQQLRATAPSSVYLSSANPSL